MKVSKLKSCCLYVFGLLCFEGDEVESRILSRLQMASIGWEFSAKILGDAKPDPGDDGAFFKLKLSQLDNPVAFREFLGDSLTKIVRDIQFGYYHNRAIFRFTFTPETKFHVIRSVRTRISALVREKCFDCFVGQDIGLEHPNVASPAKSPLRIKGIYSHTLIIMPNGTKVLREELGKIGKMQYDQIFTIQSTSYGFHLLDCSYNKIFVSMGILAPRKHYIRISPPSTIIYLDGSKLDENLFTYILDAICYGGLYQKYKIDVENEKISGHYEMHNSWSNDLMLNVFRVLNETVGVHGFNDTSLLINQSALIIAVLAILVSVLFFR